MFISVFKKLCLVGFIAVVAFYGQEARADTSLVRIIKQVRNVSQNGTLASNTNVKSGDTLEYLIRVTNTSGGSLGSITITDAASLGLTNRSNFSVSRAYTGSLDTTGVQVTNLENNASVDVYYTMQVASSSSGNTLCNTGIANVNGQNAVSTACGYVDGLVVTPTTVGLMRPSLTVVNDTKNVSGTSIVAAREDFITYKFTATNAGSNVENSYTVSADLSGVLPLADVVDLGGGNLSGNVISYPAVSIAPGASVTRQVRVRIKYNLPPYNFVLTTTYGNEVKINVQSSANAINYLAPKVGGNDSVLGALSFGLLAVLGVLFFSKKKVKQTIFG